MLVLLGLGGVGSALWFIRPSLGYTICADFKTMPDNDDSLEQWLLSQPRVAMVHIERNGQTLKVFYIINRNRFEKLPDVQRQCAHLGYAGSAAAFRDCGNRVHRE